MTMNSNQCLLILNKLDAFIDHSLGMKPDNKFLSGFHYNQDLLKASIANTYVETIGNRADSLHLAIKNVPISNIYWEYLEIVKSLGAKFELQEKDVVLAFNYTDEDFYGNSQGFLIPRWKGRDGGTKKFKFLTCSIVSLDIPQNIPLVSIPVWMGQNITHAITWCLTVIEPMVKSISLTLLNKGFYSKELMLTLSNSKYPYLIFVPTISKFRDELVRMEETEKEKIHPRFKFDINKKTLNSENTLVLLQQIFNEQNEKSYDWAFVTNQPEIDFDHIIASYKKRWKLEDGFRIQDETCIKSKSTDVNIRFFYFAYEQALQLIWFILYKDKLSFKVFMINLYEECLKRQKTE